MNRIYSLSYYLVNAASIKLLPFTLSAVVELHVLKSILGVTDSSIQLDKLIIEQLVFLPCSGNLCPGT